MPDTPPVALVTGSAHRLGARTVQTLHQRGWNLVIHYRSRAQQAGEFANHLNRERADSACCIQADLGNGADIERLAENAIARWGRLDALINNASVFYPTP
ncbi:MAG: SDR family NAD(P)-dependent oxidoreductase, partial [Marinobacter sp.]|nr:SDR family NAD(P)-dependent oxidoreductase [Marinobacter sp.]